MMTGPADDARDALEGLLGWYLAMGVDAAVDATPHDRFDAEAQLSDGTMTPRPQMPKAGPKKLASASSPSMAIASKGVSADALVREAEARAAAAPDLSALEESFAAQPGLGLAASARMIFAGGTPGARLMLVGAAPDSDDERQGEIFAGQAGRLLDAMLRAIGLDRSQVYLANLVPWRPPGNRPPTPLELSLCLPYARRHIALASPDVLLCLGERAAQPLIASRDPISKLRGRWLVYEGETATVKLLATFSPAYLLSQPLQKRRAWADLQMLASALA